jgi:hypothetical protein
LKGTGSVNDSYSGLVTALELLHDHFHEQALIRIIIEYKYVVRFFCFE